jgi:hypothetical protein
MSIVTVSNKVLVLNSKRARFCRVSNGQGCLAVFVASLPNTSGAVQFGSTSIYAE